MKIHKTELFEWLLAGDVSIQYQTKRDLLRSPNQEVWQLQERISTEGWGKKFLERRDPATGLWGNGIYSPKWISTHYTLLDLKNLGLPGDHPHFQASSAILLEKLWFNHGKVRKDRFQDLCVSAMVLSICCYAGNPSERMKEIVDYLLAKQYPDGGWNCNWDHGDQHSSVHTTLTVLEAFRDYQWNHYLYRENEIKEAIPRAEEFLLQHNLYKSRRTGEVFDPKILMLSYPSRWKYDILRCLDYFQSVDAPYHPGMAEALEILLKKQRKNHRWPVQHKHSGLTHFEMEPAGGDSRWNTLRALRVFKKYRPELTGF